jgi:hypothetical protein
MTFKNSIEFRIGVGKFVGKFSGEKQEGFVNRRKTLHDKFQAWVHKMKEIDETL